MAVIQNNGDFLKLKMYHYPNCKLRKSPNIDILGHFYCLHLTNNAKKSSEICSVFESVHDLVAICVNTSLGLSSTQLLNIWRMTEGIL